MSRDGRWKWQRGGWAATGKVGPGGLRLFSSAFVVGAVGRRLLEGDLSLLCHLAFLFFFAASSPAGTCDADIGRPSSRKRSPGVAPAFATPLVWPRHAILVAPATPPPGLFPSVGNLRPTASPSASEVNRPLLMRPSLRACCVRPLPLPLRHVTVAISASAQAFDHRCCDCDFIPRMLSQSMLIAPRPIDPLVSRRPCRMLCAPHTYCRPGPQ